MHAHLFRDSSLEIEVENWTYLLCADTVYSSHTSHPPFSRPQQDQESLAWASTLAAEMPSQLAFALEPPKYSGPQGIAALGRFNRAAEAFKELILPDLAGASLLRL